MLDGLSYSLKSFLKSLLLLLYFSIEAVRWTIRGSIPGRWEQIVLFSKMPRKNLGPIQPLFSGYRGTYPSVKRRERDAENVLLHNLVPRVRMSGALPLLSVCSFMSCTGTNLLLLVFTTCFLIPVETCFTICFLIPVETCFTICFFYSCGDMFYNLFFYSCGDMFYNLFSYSCGDMFYNLFS